MHTEVKNSHGIRNAKRFAHFWTVRGGLEMKS